jgi:hypothetical protein
VRIRLALGPKALTEILNAYECKHSEFCGSDCDCGLRGPLYKKIVAAMYQKGMRRTDGWPTNPEGLYWLDWENREDEDG